jgi:hypothetical protein
MNIWQFENGYYDYGLRDIWPVDRILKEVVFNQDIIDANFKANWFMWYLGSNNYKLVWSLT